MSEALLMARVDTGEGVESEPVLVQVGPANVEFVLDDGDIITFDREELRLALDGEQKVERAA